MYFKENLRFLRRKANMSQDKLAEMLGYKSFTTVQKWEDGTSFPVVSNLNRLSQIFNIDLDSMLNTNLTSTLVEVPILGEVKAGYDMYADENILGFEYCNVKEVNGGEFFYLRVKGDSMIDARIEDGDIVFVRKQDYINDREIGVFLINENEVTIKRALVNRNSIILKAANKKYKDRTYPLDQIKVLGRVMHNKVMF